MFSLAGIPMWRCMHPDVRGNTGRCVSLNNQGFFWWVRCGLGGGGGGGVC